METFHIQKKCKYVTSKLSNNNKIPAEPSTHTNVHHHNWTNHIYIQCSLGLSPPRFIANLAYLQNSRLS
jgi:hypothetical protein